MQETPTHAALLLQPLQLCQTAELNLYTLATHSKNTDVSEQALFFLSEMEHYSEENPPTRARLLQIARFVSACQRFRLHVEAHHTRIPELSDTQ
ncbi:MAG: hypothetical protein P8077_08025 [Gammaproteobacteria bacterium]